MSSRKDPPPSRRSTIYDLAVSAGVSPGAVSSVLNGTWKKRRISAATAERVSRIAAEQGYAPNRQASMLRRERSHVIGMIVPKYDNRYFGAIAEQFEAMARARDLFPVITCTQRDPALEQMRDIGIAGAGQMQQLDRRAMDLERMARGQDDDGDDRQQRQ